MMRDTPKHCAIIGDIKGSQEIDNWPEVFQTLREILQEVNLRFKDDILIEFKPTVGDEFQGALKTPEHAYDVYTFIRAALQVGVYFGMGIGEVENPAQGDQGGLRGTAFYRARGALELCRKQQGALRLLCSHEEHPAENSINTIIHLIEIIETSWTKRQREIICYYRLHPDSTFEQMGKHFEISASAAFQTVKATHFPELRSSEEVLKNLISSCRKTLTPLKN